MAVTIEYPCVVSKVQTIKTGEGDYRFSFDVPEGHALQMAELGECISRGVVFDVVMTPRELGSVLENGIGGRLKDD